MANTLVKWVIYTMGDKVTLWWETNQSIASKGVRVEMVERPGSVQI